MDKPIPAHQERINEELPIILNAIGRDKYWRQELLFETGYQWLVNQMGCRAYLNTQADWELRLKVEKNKSQPDPLAVAQAEQEIAKLDNLLSSYSKINSRAFWNWWRLRWEARDFTFNQELRVKNYSVTQARKRYYVYHQLPALCQDNHLITSFYLILPTLKNRPKNEKRKNSRAA